MDSFGYAIFVFAPLLALVIGGGAWFVQLRANRRIDALLSPDQAAAPSVTFSTGTMRPYRTMPMPPETGPLQV